MRKATYNGCLQSTEHLLFVLDRDPGLSRQHIAADVDIEHVECSVDGLHLANLHHPRIHILGHLHQQTMATFVGLN